MVKICSILTTNKLNFPWIIICFMEYRRAESCERSNIFRQLLLGRENKRKENRKMKGVGERIGPGSDLK